MPVLVPSFIQDDMKDSGTGNGQRGQENERSPICLKSHPLSEREGSCLDQPHWNYGTYTQRFVWRKPVYLWGDNELSGKTKKIEHFDQENMRLGRAAEKKQPIAAGCEGVRAFLPRLAHNAALLPPEDLCCEDKKIHLGLVIWKCAFLTQLFLPLNKQYHGLRRIFSRDTPYQ